MLAPCAPPLALSHVCFHSSVLGFTSQKVIPLLTVASIAHSSAALGMDQVTVIDRGGEAHAFGITAVEAGFPRRFHDLLQQCLILCKVCLHVFVLFDCGVVCLACVTLMECIGRLLHLPGLGLFVFRCFLPLCLFSVSQLL